jgi:hypothetical protein
MNLSTISRIWGKRRKLTAAMLILAAAIAITALMIMPRTYQSSASVIMLAPRAAARQMGGNPYLSFSPSLTLTASAVGDEVMAPGTAQALAARGYRSSYTVALAPFTTTTTGSVLIITVTGSDKASVQATLRAVTAQVSTALSGLQGHVAKRARIRSATLSSSSQPALSTSQTARPLILVIVPVILVALGVPVIVDGQIERRARTAPAAAGHALTPASQ